MSEWRVHCVVPHCSRWSAGETLQRKGWSSFICGSHWRRATLREKAVLHRYRRKQRRIYAISGGYDEAMIERENVVWRAIIRRVFSRPPAEPRR